MPSPARSAMRMTCAGSWVWMVTGLANRPPPRPASTSSVFEPGLVVTRLVGPPGVSGPAATPAVASRLVTSGEPAVSIADKPGPGAIGLEWTEGPVAQVLEDAHLAGQLVGDHEIEPAAAGRIDRLDVGDAQADGDRHGRQELRGNELGIDGTDETSSCRRGCRRRPRACRRPRCGRPGRSSRCRSGRPR